jgi:hypothetical protein
VFNVKSQMTFLSIQIEHKIPSSSTGGSVAPPQLPAQAPNALFGFGVPFSYNIPPGNDSVGTGVNAAAKPLNTNLQVCNPFH